MSSLRRERAPCPSRGPGGNSRFRRLMARSAVPIRTSTTMKRCEEKIRYRTTASARWALWGIWYDRYLRGR